MLQINLFLFMVYTYTHRRYLSFTYCLIQQYAYWISVVHELRVAKKSMKKTDMLSDFSEFTVWLRRLTNQYEKEKCMNIPDSWHDENTGCHGTLRGRPSWIKKVK